MSDCATIICKFIYIVSLSLQICGSLLLIFNNLCDKNISIFNIPTIDIKENETMVFNDFASKSEKENIDKKIRLINVISFIDLLIGYLLTIFALPLNNKFKSFIIILILSFLIFYIEYNCANNK